MEVIETLPELESVAVTVAVVEYEIDVVAVRLALSEVVELVVPQFDVDIEKISELVGEFVEVAETHAVSVLDTDTVEVVE